MVTNFLSNFYNIEAIEIWAEDDKTNRFVEDTSKRVLSKNGSFMKITVRHQDPVCDTENYELIFSVSSGALEVKGEFFDNPSDFKAAVPLIESVESSSYKVFEDGDPEPWIMVLEHPESLQDQGGTLGSSLSPIMAKAYKVDFKQVTTALASKDHCYIDDDGEARVYIKFLNGRIVQLEHFDSIPEDELGDIFYVHETSHVLLKKYWTSVGSAIIFSVAFIFLFKNKNGEDVDLVLRRCPEDHNQADEFCTDILAGMQAELEEMLNDGIKSAIEDGFERIEKLIVSNDQTKKQKIRPSESLAIQSRKTRKI